jgi:glycosyltransferase involved in cell wall biosynthesis
LILDDGSLINLGPIIASFNDNRIKYRRDGMNVGLPTRLNEICDLAQGKYLFRMDADDIMLPGRLSLQVAVLTREGVNCVCGGAAIVVNQASDPMSIRIGKIRRAGYSSRHSFVHPTVAAHTEWFKRNRYSTESIFRRCQDAELWVRTSATSKFINLEVPLVAYYEPAQSNIDKYTWQFMVAIALISRADELSVFTKIIYALIEWLKIALRFIFYIFKMKRMLSKRLSLDQYDHCNRLVHSALK